jgi:hypothetical protein
MLLRLGLVRESCISLQANRMAWSVVLARVTSVATSTQALQQQQTLLGQHMQQLQQQL